jgi:AcrR family transcriptional regulator
MAESSGGGALWGQRAQPSRGPKPALGIERVTHAAIGIADAEGLAAVSMRRVADEFGFTAMSLYRYVPGRTELLDLMIDIALGQAPELDTETRTGSHSRWRPALEEWTRRVHAVYRRHPWLVEATTRHRRTGPNELGWLERAVNALDGTGLSGPERVDAAVVLLSHVRSHVQYEIGMAPEEGAEDLSAALSSAIQEHAADYPALVAAADEGAFGPNDNDGFEFGLRCILHGIDAIITSRTRSDAPEHARPADAVMAAARHVTNNP